MNNSSQNEHPNGSHPPDAANEPRVNENVRHDGSNVWVRVASDSLVVVPDAAAPNGTLSAAGNGDFYGNYAGYVEPSDSFDFQKLLAQLKRYRWAFAVTWLSVFALALLYSLLAPRVYQSDITLLMQNRSGASAAMNDLPVLGDMLSSTQARSVKTQIALIKRPELLEQSISSLPPKRRDSLREYVALDITSSADSDLLELGVRSLDPQAAKALANAIGVRYIQLNRERNRHQLHQAATYLKTQLDAMRQKLDVAQVRLLNWKQANKTIDPEAEATAQIQQLGDIEGQWRQARAEKDALNARLAKLQQLAGKTPPSTLVPQEVVRRPAVEAMKTELTRLELEKVAVAQEYSPTSPKMQDLTNRIEEIRERLKTEAQTEVGSWQTDPVATALRQEIAETQTSIWDREARGVALKRQSIEARAALERVPKNQYQVAKLSGDLETLRKTYALLNDKYQQVRISEEAEVASAQIISWAKLPDTPVSPRIARNLILATVLGLILGLMVVTGLGALDNRVHTAEDAEAASGRSVLARVPQLRGASSALLQDPYTPSPMLETYRMLRTNLEFAAIDQPLKLLAITSSQPNEGKSTSAANLAIISAMDGKRVILVDCDLRRPSVHTLFQVPNLQGLTSVIAGKSSLQDGLQDTKLPTLKILPSGPIPPNPSELLNSRTGRDTLRSLADHADLVILDCPPGLMMADAQIVASNSDAVVVVVSIAEAGRRELAQTTQQLARSGTRILGVVLNKVEFNNAHYKYYGEYLKSRTDDARDETLAVR